MRRVDRVGVVNVEEKGRGESDVIEGFFPGVGVDLSEDKGDYKK